MKKALEQGSNFWNGVSPVDYLSKEVYGLMDLYTFHCVSGHFLWLA